MIVSVEEYLNTSKKYMIDLANITCKSHVTYACLLTIEIHHCTSNNENQDKDSGKIALHDHQADYRIV